MEKKITFQKNIYQSEEEKTLNNDNIKQCIYNACENNQTYPLNKKDSIYIKKTISPEKVVSIINKIEIPSIPTL